jgi:hypothetical protein
MKHRRDNNNTCEHHKIHPQKDTMILLLLPLTKHDGRSQSKSQELSDPLSLVWSKL